MTTTVTRYDGCACCGCPERCVGIGSLFIHCPVCGESPRYWTIPLEGFRKPWSSDPLFACCPNLSFQFTLGLLLGDPAGGCVWQSPVIDCGGGLTAQWTLAYSTLDPGGITLIIDFSDGRRVVYVNQDIWQCLCTNVMIRDRGSDLGDVDSCGIPESLCVNPTFPCCGSRTDPMPRTLVAQLTDFSNCPCVAGVTFNLDWDPSTDQWIGSGAYCSSTFTIKISCWRTYEVTDWHGTVQWSGATFPCANSPEVDIGVGIVGAITIAECDPVHLRFQISNTLGCCNTFANVVQVDIVEM